MKKIITARRLLPGFGLIRDYIRLRKSGVFMSRAYGQRYLGRTDLPAMITIWHYLLIGERRGAWANPFFDPAAVRDGLVPRLATYLDCTNVDEYRPSPHFDARWYRRQMPAGSIEVPLVHFWNIGFDKGLDPALHFQCDFFKSVVAFGYADKAQHAFDCLATSEPSEPINEADLLQRQQRFRKLISVKALKQAHAPCRRRLVFLQTAHDSDIPYLNDNRSFDLLVNYYDRAPEVVSSAEYSFFQRGTKTTAVATLLESNPDILLSYSFVLLLDDDVRIAAADIELLFDISEENHLDLAQPALTVDSATFFPDLKQPLAGSGIRYLTAVEIMAPVVSRRALETCGWTFAESISGWGVDLLLAAEVRRSFGKNRIALISDVVAAHLRSVDTNEGVLYKFLASHGLDPYHELGRIAWRHTVSTECPSIRFCET